MANSKANIIQVPLNSELNLNKLDSDIRQFQGFNKNNAPFLGGCLSTLYKKELDADSNSIVDKDGNIISYDPESKYFKKNGQDWIYNSNKDTEVLIRKEAKFWNEYTGAEVPSGEVVAAIPYDEENVYDYVLWNEKEGKLYLCYYYVENDVVIHDFKKTLANYEELPRDSIGLFRDGNLLFASLFGVYNKNVYKSSCTFKGLSVAKIDNNYYAGNSVDGNGDTYLAKYDSSGNQVWLGGSFHPWGVGATEHTNKYIFNYVQRNSTRIDGYIYFYVALGTSNIPLAIDVKYIDCDANGRMTPRSSSTLITITDLVSTTSEYKKFNDYIRHQVYCLFQNSTGKKPFYLGWWEDNGFDSNAYGYNFYSEGFPQMITKQGFSFLYNSDELSGISKNGILLTEWFSVDPLFCGGIFGNSVLYKDTTTKQIIIVSSVQDFLEAKYSVFDNKLFTNFGSGVYVDLLDGTIGKAFNDFNGRLPYSKGTSSFIASGNTKFIAAGINQDFAGNKDPIISMLVNPITFESNSASPSFSFANIEKAKNVDVYLGQTNPIYYKSLGDNSAVDVIKPEKVGLEWTSETGGNLIMTPSVFASFISSGLKMDIVKEDKNGYKLLNYNNHQVLGFYLNSLIENVQNVFVIQGNAYAIIDSLIYSYDVQNGVNVGSMPIVDIHDLQFLASTPYKAFFYSPLTQSVLSFNGSNTLNYEFTATKINVVIDSVYNPDTLSIIFTSDKEVIFITRFGMFSNSKLSLANDERIFVTKKGIAILYPSINKCQFLRYTKTTSEDADAFDRMNIELETCFYGLENQKMSVNDCVYLRLFDDEKSVGQIEIEATTISLATKESDKTIINVKPSDWDKDSCTLFLRYQPKRQRGLGTSFKIKSPFNIVSMAIGNTPDANLIDNVSKGSQLEW